ncbi:MAG: hypothetical protein HOB82_07620 [Alphaproteobacteria bacterium]|nr:hypothetical protein [Alphaproteobacteria bacterium]
MHAPKPTILAKVAGSLSLDIQTGVPANIQGLLTPGTPNLLDGDMAQECAKLQALHIKQQLRLRNLAIANAGHQKIFELLG